MVGDIGDEIDVERAEDGNERPRMRSHGCDGDDDGWSAGKTRCGIEESCGRDMKGRGDGDTGRMANNGMMECRE